MSGRGRRTRGRPRGRGAPDPVKQVALAVPIAPVAQPGMTDFTKEIAGAQRDTVEALRGEAPVPAPARVETSEERAAWVTREFFRVDPPEFLGEPDPVKTDDWLEQMIKIFEMLRVHEDELRLTLATFKLKGDANQWWKYAKTRTEATWEAFTRAFLEKYLPPSAREKLRQQFVNLRQESTPLSQFEATFTSLSRFAPELVATEERRCIEFEERLTKEIKLMVAGSMIRDYARLVKTAAHLEHVIAEEKEIKQLGAVRTRTQDFQFEGRANKRQRGRTSYQQQQQPRSTLVLLGASSGKSGQSKIICYHCGQPGHKAPDCHQKKQLQRQQHSQAQGQSQGRGPPTCYHCGQAGHLWCNCTQGRGTQSALGSRKTQSHQTGQGQRAYQQSVQLAQGSRATQATTSTQSVQQPNQQRTGEVDQRTQGRVYAVTTPNQTPGSSVVRGGETDPWP